MVGAAISGLFLILAKKIGLSENHHCCFQYKCDYRLHLCLQKVSTASSLFLLCSQSYHVSLSLLWTRLAFRLLSPHLTLNQSCLFVNSHFPCSSLSLSPKIWKGHCCGGRTILGHSHFSYSSLSLSLILLSLLWGKIPDPTNIPKIWKGRCCGGRTILGHSHFSYSSLSLSLILLSLLWGKIPDPTNIPKIWKGLCCGGRTILGRSLCHRPGLHIPKLHLNCGAKVIFLIWWF